MATSPSPPILIWQPAGGVPGGPISNPPIYSQADSTVLIDGQQYVDVVFGSIQTDDEWVLVECVVVNELDAEPLNIWPGIITDKTAAGFRMYLNGLPDSGNYYLHWAVSGINIAPIPATLYLLSGPATGGIHVESSDFTVRLPPSTTFTGTNTVTPDDGGAGGTFTPASVDLTGSSRIATFTYTPSAYGAITISATNSAGLSDPTSIAFTCVATGYALSGPSTGVSGVASTDFTLELPAGSVVIGTVTVTPHDASDGGTFTPTTATLTTVAPTDTFTYTPASTGDKTISVTNNGGLTNPGNLTYTASAPGLSDGDPVSSWLDSSINANSATQTGSARPIFKTNIINGKPVVRFASAASSKLNLTTPISGAAPFTVLMVAKGSAPGSDITGFGSNLGSGSVTAPILHAGGAYGFSTPTQESGGPLTVASNIFHVLALNVAAGTGYVFQNGTAITTAPIAGPYTGNLDNIGYGFGFYTSGDIAELIFYNVTLGSTDRANLEKYLADKYGLTVAGGSAVQPDTVTGLQAWWKADSL